MATILLSAAGVAIGSGFGGSVLGLSGAVIGRAVGATVGRVIDQRVLGAGSEAVEVGRVDRFRLTGASEGSAVKRVFGRVRISGQVIWASRFEETVSSSGGGKGTPQPKTTQFSYTVSLAIALCEGEISSVGRIWADGNEISRADLNIRVYTGSDDQLPDPKIEAVEGAGNAPAYRGIAYVVIDGLALAPFGNRVPQFSFEVVRPAQSTKLAAAADIRNYVKAAAIIPGTGEYALAMTPVYFSDGIGGNRAVNVNSPSGKTDFVTSLDQMSDELPNCKSLSLVVSWFGNDLRCGACSVEPKTEQHLEDGVGMPWRVSGLGRTQAKLIAREGDRPIYGGTPSDQSVVQAIRHAKANGFEVMFYPFILMDQTADNQLPNPWSDTGFQPVLPWRGRITLSKAPGLAGSPDGTAVAEQEVAVFFGNARATDFSVSGDQVVYSGPQEWSYRRFVLHYAMLAKLAGGIEAFCIGSELRGLTAIKGVGESFAAVEQLCALVEEVRAILGPETKLTYAADWSEYFGHHDGAGNVWFNLDRLWAHPDIDFIGIDNYMPLSDWRDGAEHKDRSWKSIYNLDYLKANICGGEGFDWYYEDADAVRHQRRTEIRDLAYGEDWIYRYKDLRGWWSNSHHNRINGVRQETATAWKPMSKPIVFTEIGCAAIDKGTNEPNKFLDPKSSESSLPRFSNGARDDHIQHQYLRAMAEYWASPANNPVSDVYGAPMLDSGRMYVWAWDARPFPAFPNNTGLWSDGTNHSRGHWLNGRASNQSLAAVISEIVETAGVRDVALDTVHGTVRGYGLDDIASARSALQPLMVAYGCDVAEREGELRFAMRSAEVTAELSADGLAVSDELDSTLVLSRSGETEGASRITVAYVEAEGDFEIRTSQASFPDDASLDQATSEMQLSLTPYEARATAERWLAEARVARDTLKLALPPSMARLGAGDVLRLCGESFRIDRCERAGLGLVEAVKTDQSIFSPVPDTYEPVAHRPFSAPVPVFSVFLDVPLITAQQLPTAPLIAVSAQPWPGSVAVWAADSDAGYELSTVVTSPSVLGKTLSPLFKKPAGRWSTSETLRVRLARGALAGASETSVLNGANLFAIGDGTSGRWEIAQFRDAELVSPGVYDLTGLLRGQFGSDALMPEVWPEGAVFVKLDKTITQLPMEEESRGLARHYKVGPAARSVDDPVYDHRVEAFDGNGLRPYSVVHLQSRTDGMGNVRISWVRRTRIDGDTWASFEVPLGEERELYAVRMTLNGEIVRSLETATPTVLYTASERAVDGTTGPFGVQVAQISDRFGPGPFRAIEVGL